MRGKEPRRMTLTSYLGVTAVGFFQCSQYLFLIPNLQFIAVALINPQEWKKLGRLHVEPVGEKSLRTPSPA